MSKQYDVEVVRQTAVGRWKDILSHLAAMPPESLDGQHHPCPQCGGSDRFRAFDNFDRTGGILCDHCIGRCGDGFKALEQITGKKFIEVVGMVADYLGVQPKGTKQQIDPAKDLKFQNWSSQLALCLLAKKKGLTEAAMLAAGCRLAQYKNKYTVFAFPVIGNSLDVENPVGWALMDYQGNELPVWDKSGNITRTTKVKLTPGSKPGLFGIHAIERLKTVGLVELVWKCEGLSDMLCLWSQIPDDQQDRIVAISTANGSEENPRWQASFLASHDVNVVHDADEPGQRGATKWVQAIALQQSADKIVRNVELPYAVEGNHGKDIRDYFNEGHSYADLEALAGKSTATVIERNEDGTIKDKSVLRYPMYEQIMKLLEIEVNEEYEDGSIEIFSMNLRKNSVIKSATRISKTDMIQHCGEPAIEHISNDPDTESKIFDMKQVGEAIAYAACRRREKFEKCGFGVWQGLDDFGAATGSIILVNNDEAARWNGDKVLRRVLAPRVDGLALRFCTGNEDFYDFDELARNLQNAGDVDWCKAVIDQCTDLFSRWRWRNNVTSPTILTGLVLASYIQTIWDWRPQVSITGESRSGKSYLFQAIGGSETSMGLLGNLASRCSQSTEAAIRAAIGSNALVVIIDEFEESKERKAIMKKIVRPASRGDTVSRATSGMKKVDFHIRHILWTAAIESGLEEQADANRFIHLELLAPEESKQGRLELPDSRELLDLGQRLLAIAVRYAVESKALASRLRGAKVPGVDPRTIECYAVIAAILACSQGMSEEEASSLVVDLAGSIDISDQGAPDHEELLDAILASRVHCGSKDGMLSVAQILHGANWINQPQRFAEHRDKLEAEGIRLTDNEDLFVYHIQVKRGLLRGTRWEGQRIDQLLKRLPGARSQSQRVSGRAVKGIVIPRDCMRYVEGDEFSAGGGEIKREDVSLNGDSVDSTHSEVVGL
jgi:hypothetical protein